MATAQAGKSPTSPVQPADGDWSCEALPSQVRVLILDDLEDAADSLAFLLGNWGYESRVCYHGAKAIQIATTYRPHVVLLDLGLPDIDGLAVARHLRNTPGLRDAVLIAVTGRDGVESRQAAKEAGFDHYMIKPVDLVQLEDILGGILRQCTDRNRAHTDGSSGDGAT